MIETTFDKENAKLMAKSRLPIIIPSIIIGTLAGIYHQTSGMNNDLKITYGIVAPSVIIIGFIAAFLGAKLSADKLINVKFQLTDNELKRIKGDDTITIKLDKISYSKLNMFGLKIKDQANSIFIPKQINDFSKFNDQLINKSS
jgi:hypothetical protein